MQATSAPPEPADQRILTRRVLLVEDDDEIRSALQLLLEHEGYEVDVAVDGKQGIQLARSILPDLIVMDLVLPEMNGFDAALTLRAEERTAGIPLVAVTASWLGSEAQRLQTIGFDGALRKPFSREDLLNELRRHLPN